MWLNLPLSCNNVRGTGGVFQICWIDVGIYSQIKHVVGIVLFIWVYFRVDKILITIIFSYVRCGLLERKRFPLNHIRRTSFCPFSSALGSAFDCFAINIAISRTRINLFAYEFNEFDKLLPDHDTRSLRTERGDFLSGQLILFLARH